MEFILLVLLLFLAAQQHKQQRKLNNIMATQNEEAEQLNQVKEQLSKATGEIVAKIGELTSAVEAAGVTSPEVDQATSDLKSLAQQLDDIVPDSPVG